MADRKLADSTLDPVTHNIPERKQRRKLISAISCSSCRTTAAAFFKEDLFHMRKNNQKLN